MEKFKDRWVRREGFGEWYDGGELIHLLYLGPTIHRTSKDLNKSMKYVYNANNLRKQPSNISADENEKRRPLSSGISTQLSKVTTLNL